MRKFFATITITIGATACVSGAIDATTTPAGSAWFGCIASVQSGDNTRVASFELPPGRDRLTVEYDGAVCLFSAERIGDVVVTADIQCRTVDGEFEAHSHEDGASVAQLGSVIAAISCRAGLGRRVPVLTKSTRPG